VIKLDNPFIKHINTLIQIRKHSIYYTGIATCLAVSFWLMTFILGIFSVAMISVYLLVLFIVSLLFIHQLKILRYYKRIKALHEENPTLIRELLELNIEEAFKYQNHWFLKRQAHHFIQAYKAYQGD
jgi:hypothetical protein